MQYLITMNLTLGAVCSTAVLVFQFFATGLLSHTVLQPRGLAFWSSLQVTTDYQIFLLPLFCGMVSMP